MKNSTKSLFSITLLAIFAFSMVGQILVSDFELPANNLQESSTNNIHTSAYDTNFGIQPLELNSDQLNDLGIIEIFNFMVRDEIDGSYFNQSDDANVDYDHTIGEIINPSIHSTLIAADSLQANGTAESRNAVITIILNETVRWNYSSDAVSYLVGFSPYVQPATLLELYMNESVVDPSNYSSTYDSNDVWFNYNFTHLFENASEGEFTLLYQYTVDIPISAWRVTTLDLLLEEDEENEEEIPLNSYQYLNGNETTIVMGYEYNITFGSEDWNYNVSARYKITLPSPTSIYDLEMISYTDKVIDPTYFVMNNNIVTLEFWTHLANLESFGMSFKANFTVEMLEKIDDGLFWCEDRLVSFPNERERDYKLSITDGPDNLAVSYFTINETGIYFADLQDPQIVSAIGRNPSAFDMNTSTGDPSGTIVSGNTTLDYVDGISILNSPLNFDDPYVLFKGEIDIVTISYLTVLDLQLVIADNTKTPMEGIQANIYFANQLYGSKMSLFRNFPLSTRISDANGRIEVFGVPRGNYIIEIFDAQGQPLQNLTASSLSDFDGNLLVTNMVHFPSVIIFFTGISSALVVGGVVIYKKKK
ncbi:MAG: hypothetical protein ACTSVZ_06935 [Promethearchaeota archaeon]